MGNRWETDGKHVGYMREINQVGERKISTVDKI